MSTEETGFAPEPGPGLFPEPDHEPRAESLAERIDRALQDSIDSCARCKTCDKQVDAVMAVLRDVISEDNAAAEALAEDRESALPEGEFGRIELPGYRNHTGWVTEETRFGVQMAVIRDWDGRVVAEVAPGPLCQFVHLPTPLKRPEPQERAAITGGDPWGRADDHLYEDEEGGPF